ncbi:hypothetical protein [Conexibacter sp. CPCC 206217]|uniref:hypothetical protein n=1 Tax=Conexibacter sp. CPCC 206217 TaxID=3064574 RepID=UPI00271AB25B|nr:hypothetical protein [Conexibacter sp. CPCC 206217]MDO8211729.1 hypothetical protein [Conexibacter sp. CPCC 206217]
MSMRDVIADRSRSRRWAGASAGSRFGAGASAGSRFGAGARKLVAALVLAALLPASAAAAPPDADRPAGAADFVAVTAENGTPGDLQALLDVREAGPDAGVPRCLGDASFARTAWAWIAASDRPQRVVVEATPQDGSTRVPDLALFPQDPVVRSTADVSEPSACDGRETLGDGIFADGPTVPFDVARGDGSAAVSAVLRAGRPALVQVGWREGDEPAPLLVTLHREPLDRQPLPAGDDPADAPVLTLGTPTAVVLRGATLGRGDPAEPACPAPATVWRRVDLPAAGAYAVAATGAAQTLTAFAGSAPTGDSSLACADLADTATLGLTPRIDAAGTMWVRLGVDRPEADASAQVVVSGPYADERAATDALPRPGEPLVPGRARASGLACVRAAAPRLTISAASMRRLHTRRSRTLAGTARQPCDPRHPRAQHISIALAKRAGRQCRWFKRGRFGGRGARSASCSRPLITLSARGVTRWSRRLPRLAPGRYLIVVQLEASRPRSHVRRIGSRTRRAFTVVHGGAIRRTTTTRRGGTRR